MTPHWIQTKYTSHGDPIPLATYEEAQLILAEAAGSAAAAVEHINNARAAHGLPPVSASAVGDLQALLIEERRREFFFEGRFHADKLRYDLWFPEATGFNHKNVAYGPTTCLPLSDNERTLNPNIS